MVCRLKIQHKLQRFIKSPKAVTVFFNQFLCPFWTYKWQIGRFWETFLLKCFWEHKHSRSNVYHCFFNLQESPGFGWGEKTLYWLTWTIIWAAEEGNKGVECVFIITSFYIVITLMSLSNVYLNTTFNIWCMVTMQWKQ